MRFKTKLKTKFDNFSFNIKLNMYSFFLQIILIQTVKKQKQTNNLL